MPELNRSPRMLPDERNNRDADRLHATHRLEALERRIDGGYMAASGLSGVAGLGSVCLAAYDYVWLHDGPMATAGVALAGVLLSAASWCGKKAAKRRARRTGRERRRA
ncbi:hypothetical protein ACFZB6_32765 [Streptomyces syringium]|uniref:hypothetical protein n=2 Tax=Streptomyces syringium TaxID=76729 RepID=UPI003439DA24